VLSPGRVAEPEEAAICEVPESATAKFDTAPVRGLTENESPAATVPVSVTEIPSNVMAAPEENVPVCTAAPVSRFVTV